MIEIRHLSRHPFSPVMFFPVIMLVAILSSCRDDIPVGAGHGNPMSLRIDLQCAEMSTRANDGEYMDSSGSINECYIDYKQLWIGVFDGDGKLCSVWQSEAGRDDIVLDISGLGNDEDMTIAVLANWKRYGVDYERLGETGTLENLRGLSFSFPPEDLADDEPDVLPMSGIKEISLSTLSDMESGKVVIELDRGLAKIEIVDNTDGDVKIESALLPVYPDSVSLFVEGDGVNGSSTDNGLEFSKKEGSKVFYLYVPGMSLGDDLKGNDREILLSFSDGSQKTVYLAPYEDDGVMVSDNADISGWESLKRNHIYRLYITGTLPAPEIEIQDTLRICWYLTERGKFSCQWINYTFSDSCGLYSKNRNTQSDNDKDTSKDLNRLYRYYNVDFSNVIEKKEMFGRMRYYLGEGISDSYKNGEVYLSSVANDVVKMENIGEITYCWLDTYVLDQIISGSSLPVGTNYRVYWKGPQIDYDFKLDVASGKEIKTGKIGYDESREYWYVDYEIISPDIKRVNYCFNNDKEFETLSDESYWYIGIEDLTFETIDSKEYYVYYIY